MRTGSGGARNRGTPLHGHIIFGSAYGADSRVKFRLNLYPHILLTFHRAGKVVCQRHIGGVGERVHTVDKQYAPEAGGTLHTIWESGRQTYSLSEYESLVSAKPGHTICVPEGRISQIYVHGKIRDAVIIDGVASRKQYRDKNREEDDYP